MPITKPSIGDPTKKTLADAIIDALAAAEVDIAAIVGERLVTNGSFEVDSDSDGFPDQWTRTLYTGGAFALVSDTGTGANSAHGLKAIKFTHPGGGGNGGGQIQTHADTFIEVTPNRSYWLSWMNKNSVAGLTNSVEILGYDATETQLYTHQIYTATTVPTSWKLFRAHFDIADPLVRYIKIRFKCGETSASTAGDVYIDNVQLQQMTCQRVEFTAPGTFKWKAPDDVRVIELDLFGGGGGGGSSNGSGTGGGGGGGGAHCYAQVAVTPGVSYDITIGAGGAGGDSGSSGVGTGGASTTITIGATTYTAGGGTAGTRGSSGGAGGAGGTATNGDVNTSGTSGGSGTGAPLAGDGGYSGFLSSYATTGAAGAAGFNGPLAGGGGSGGRTSTNAAGSGHDGAALIRW